MEVRYQFSCFVFELGGFDHFDGELFPRLILSALVNYREFTDTNFLFHFVKHRDGAAFVELQVLHPLIDDRFVFHVESFGSVNLIPVCNFDAPSFVLLKYFLGRKSVQTDNRDRHLHFIFSHKQDGAEERDDDCLGVTCRLNIDVCKGFELHLFGGEERLKSVSVNFPDLAVEALVVVVV